MREVKGVKGNRGGGRPKQDPDITALAKKESPKAFQQIIKISRDTAVDPSIRLRACAYILDRAYGKPVPSETSVEQKELTVVVDISGTEPEELRAVTAS